MSVAPFSRTDSTRDDWRTPSALIAEIERFAPIGLDPAGHPRSLVGAEYQLLQPEFDGLREAWTDFGLVYVNPPYGPAMSAWSAKVAHEARRGAEVMLLCAARVETKWFHENIWRAASAILFFNKRICFVSPDGSEGAQPAFPVVLAYYGWRAKRFQEMYDGRLGKVVLL